MLVKTHQETCMRLPLTILLMFALPCAVSALEAPSRATGKILFETPHLGTSGQSCASCHLDGKGLEQLRRMDDATLTATVNRCIASALRGSPLDPSSTEMESLILYLRSLTSPDP